MFSYAFLDSKVSHALGESQSPSFSTISMHRSCLSDPTSKTPQGKGMLAGEALCEPLHQEGLSSAGLHAGHSNGMHGG